MLQEAIDKEVRKFGKKLAIYMKANLEEALGKNVQESSLTFGENIEQTEDGIKLQIIASGEYWSVIEKGRKAGKKMPPSKSKGKDVMGKDWFVSKGIDPREIVYQMQVRYKEKRKSLSKINRTLSKTPKKLSYIKAVKQASFIFRRAIAKNGIEAKPFVQKSLQDANVDQFTKTISEVMGKQIIVDLQMIQFEKIKLTL